ncbi:unnamed protein product [Triticum turgidum subsp. durum]|uniref:Uncharacterized protein n=1 Tax=Triticum turgidum subsp. durum TaxID=4567 RepID=A0A9R0T6I5_TRITD|nr:unnamed protein product [Triticum turgidum subsp. durum]
MGASESVPETSVHEFTVKVIHLLAESRHPASFFFFSNLFGGNFESRIATARSGFTETNYTQLTELYQKYYMLKRPGEDCVPMFVEIIGCHFSGLSGAGIG